MNDFYTVLIIGTIHSEYGTIHPNERFLQTLEAINSVRTHIPNSKIFYIDNSNTPLHEDIKNILQQNVDVFRQMEHNLFSRLANHQHVRDKSPAECNLMDYALQVIKDHPDFIGKRIFKLSGRYKISDSFDLSFYDNPALKGKYTLLPRMWATSLDGFDTVRHNTHFETALISFDSELLDEFKKIHQGMLLLLQKWPGTCIEEAMYQSVPHEKVFPIEKQHVEGIKADGDKYLID